MLDGKRINSLFLNTRYRCSDFGLCLDPFLLKSY